MKPPITKPSGPASTFQAKAGGTGLSATTYRTALEAMKQAMRDDRRQITGKGVGNNK